MPYPDLPKEKSYSWFNILLIIICISMFGYSIYFFTYPEQNHKLIERLGLSTLLSRSSTKVNENTSTSSQQLQGQASAVQTVQSPIVSTTEPTVDEQPIVELPALVESDPEVLLSMQEFSQPELMNNRMLQNGIINSTVVFIDNFSRGDFIASFSPLLPPILPFVIDTKAGQTFVSKKSYQRYDNYANYIDSLDSEKFVEAYQTYKPLIDESYSEIARPGSEFHDVLNNAIDVALSVPVIKQPISLHSPSVMYLFDDPSLEALNDAQKLMLRFGPDNLTKIQNKLKEIQAVLNKPAVETSEFTE
ncbi:hypothetical protein DS885_15785 [Psychromonas sp. B3M02]|uniref:DUF3014 domain-containing protein n=1 Tax=Psychromonas sp. B3M02 TaxID=2267226 RepID=UPI000DEB7986|nr:DUF3014 domain-containing protein [Psychromonas sp. B3M02]RBW41681.1 hypothetical protein DS885_15785 [Psychromonas sp. B3M02]